MKALTLFVLLVTSLSSCTVNYSGSKKNAITGIIEKRGMTTYQYGTHIIKTENKIYAIKSDAINFDQYLNRTVSIWGKKVKGYPLDGGPELINVTLIKF